MESRRSKIKRYSSELLRIFSGLVAPLLLLSQSIPNPPAFEVISVRPSQTTGGSIIWKLAGGRFKADRVSLKTLIEYAYDITDDQLDGGEKWTTSDHFDIVATPEHAVGNDPVFREQQVKLMIRSLLADRFRLKLTHRTKELPVYLLSLDKNPPKLEPTVHDPGRQVRVSRNGQLLEMTFQAAPVTYFARYLSTQLKRLVVDQTDIQGAFDFTLEWEPNLEATLATATSADGPPSMPAAEADSSGPSIFTAI